MASAIGSKYWMTNNSFTYRDGATLVESMAIIQYLEDIRPEPSLMPSSPLLKARVREVVETVVSGIQPLQNLGLKLHFDSEQKYTDFTKYWTERGLQTLDKLLKESSGRYCIGDELTLADLCLVPQIYNAVTRHKLDIQVYPILAKLYESLLKEKIISETHPEVIRGKKL